MNRRFGLVVTLAVLLALLPTVAAAASSAVPPSRRSSVLTVHRAEHRWHLGQMDKNHVTFHRLNASLHRRSPLLGRWIGDPALRGTDSAQHWMEMGDSAFLRFHEAGAPRR